MQCEPAQSATIKTEIQSDNTLKDRVTLWLSEKPVALTIYASLTAFAVYSCMYVFRKSFTAATFSDHGEMFKEWLIISQAIGYAMSKFAGIKVVSEVTFSDRGRTIIKLMTIAGLSWLGFALFPYPFDFLFTFLNGLMLGMIWGLVFGFLEGRQSTELMAATLSASFIVSSGFSRSAGAYLVQSWHVPDIWMPAVASGLFFIPLILSVRLLEKVPPPNAEDMHMRTHRPPIPASRRKHFIRSFLPGIVMFIPAYMLLTVFRDFRDNFTTEIWKEAGIESVPALFTNTELPIALTVLPVMASLMLIRSNRLALVVIHFIILVGLMLTGLSAYLFAHQIISAFLWMILTGTGLYMAYVPFNCLFFERLIAAFRYPGTSAFIMYVADAMGYLGSVGILLFKIFFEPGLSWLKGFIQFGYFTAGAGIILITGSLMYFHRKQQC